MNQGILTVLVVIGAVLLTILIMCILNVAKDKGVDIKSMLIKSADIYGTAATIATAIQPFLPQPYAGIIGTIFKYADKAVHTAENAYKAGECEADQRKENATVLIYDALKDQNIEIDEKVKKLVDIATETLVRTLPKTNTTESK